MDYRKYYNLEGYLFNEVHQRFTSQGWINQYDLHCIFIWKSNRAKHKNAKKVMVEGQTYGESAKAFTQEIANAPTMEEKFLLVTGKYKFLLPTASAILTVFYPDSFSVFDYRVCEQPEMTTHGDLSNKSGKSLWAGYQQFLADLKRIEPSDLTFREKDKYLWGWSFHKDLEKDCGELIA